ncbi:NADH dehydrogenase [ubiquinone] 1 alpha subcomplex assembly factor 3-like [Watersipora subatra]|uniref:NADH dehydrogenase [ubiquinone] 1 alpha subcomplex assembly factor 3-like n=1 Tax=Watersipora subatra TaxID=2589382 RepID=UPI00355AE22E
MRARFPFLLSHNKCYRKKLRFYSSWFRKVPAQSQFSADVEGEPYKTTVTVENQAEHYLQIDSYSTLGFKLNNGFRTIGPLALFPRTALFWNIGGAENINIESLSLFTVLEPKLDLLLVGVGEPEGMELVSKDLYKVLKNKGIGLELLTTHQACATFNYLNGERRCVAAALLPPKKIQSRNETFYLQETLNKDPMEAPQHYVTESGKRIPLAELAEGWQEPEDKRHLAELPERYADAPESGARLPDSQKPHNPELPDGQRKT